MAEKGKRLDTDRVSNAASRLCKQALLCDNYTMSNASGSLASVLLPLLSCFGCPASADLHRLPCFGASASLVLASALLPRDGFLVLRLVASLGVRSLLVDYDLTAN